MITRVFKKKNKEWKDYKACSLARKVSVKLELRKVCLLKRLPSLNRSKVFYIETIGNMS